MSDDDDEYLWSGQGTPSEDVLMLERSLAPLRWRAQPHAEPSVAPKVIELPPRSKWWPTVVAGVIAAAAVLALAMWVQPGSSVEERSPAINPTAPPSPDLKDPFGPREPGFTAPITDPDPVPPVAPSVSPDLKDPFADEVDEREPKPREPKRRDGGSPDLKDPFGDGDLVDPFGARSEPPPKHSPDLKDPFDRRSELDAHAEAGEDG